ncbi:Ldh family oxidoreductase [Leucobacter chironomi]|uniref:Ldh family oxidoreductase n=1 Tax=Leucobacter chironomi TaxID=491918 RepID=UPI0009FD1F59|nr:Ldh family oxidoreductase [Leucobacter chironomi]
MGEVLSAGAPVIEVAPERLQLAVARALAPHAAAAGGGFAAQDADRAACWIVQAEQLGLAGFGVDMLLRDLRRVDIGSRSADAVAAPSAVGAIAGIDAAGTPGPLALAAAVRIAEAAVESHGIGLVGVRNVGALGVLGLAARSLAERGRVALISAQAPAMVAPWGGSAPAIGTNPLAFGAPRAGGAPLVADFATSRITLAELRRRRDAGEQLPEDVAIDAEGRPTADPDAVAALLPEGRLGSLAGLLVEVIAGAAVGGRAPAGAPADGRGAVVIAVDPARAGGARVAETCAEIAEEWRAAGGHVPGRFDALGSSSSDTSEAPGAPDASIRLRQTDFDALFARAEEARA